MECINNPGYKCSKDVLKKFYENNSKSLYYDNTSNSFNFLNNDDINFTNINDKYDSNKKYNLCSINDNNDFISNCVLDKKSPWFSKNALGNKCVPILTIDSNVNIDSNLKISKNNLILNNIKFKNKQKNGFCENRWYDWYTIQNFQYNNYYYNNSSNLVDVYKCYKPCDDYNYIPYLSSVNNEYYCLNKDIAYNGIYFNTPAFTPLAMIFLLGSTKLDLIHYYIELYNKYIEAHKNDYDIDDIDNLYKKNITYIDTILNEAENKRFEVINKYFIENFSVNFVYITFKKNNPNFDNNHLDYNSSILKEPDDNTIKIMENNLLFEPSLLKTCYDICRYCFDNKHIIYKNNDELINNSDPNIYYPSISRYIDIIENNIYKKEPNEYNITNLKSGNSININDFNKFSNSIDNKYIEIKDCIDTRIISLLNKINKIYKNNINDKNIENIIIKLSNIFKKCSVICFSDTKTKFRKYIYDILTNNYKDIYFNFDMLYKKEDFKPYINSNVISSPDDKEKSEEKSEEKEKKSTIFIKDYKDNDININNNNYIDIPDKNVYQIPDIPTIINYLLALFTFLIFCYIMYIFYDIFSPIILWIFDVIYTYSVYIWLSIMNWSTPPIRDYEYALFVERNLRDKINRLDKKVLNIKKDKI